MFSVRHSAVQRVVTALLLPFIFVSLNGTGLAWLIYEFEWEDILTHHYQTLDPNDLGNKELGRAYVREILDKNTGQDPTLPKPPVIIQELRAILASFPTSISTQTLAQLSIPPRAEGAPQLGFFEDVFRPPALA